MARRQFVSFHFSDLHSIKQKVLNWSAGFGTCCFLDNQEYHSETNSYECLAAVGEIARIKSDAGHAFEELRKFSEKQKDWIFGHFSFGLKSETEDSPSLLPDFIGFPDLFFFIPKVVIIVHQNEIRIGTFGNKHLEIYEQILTSITGETKIATRPPLIQQRISREEYIGTIQNLQKHINRGDCYEINFCQEFYSVSTIVNPLALFRSLQRISPSPFSSFYSADNRFLLCASPERYLKRKASIILSQPMKGTTARDPLNEEQDARARDELFSSEKDRAENVMVVDLVRNDLSKICEPDSVRVTELFGIYSFAQVHQMVSTITGKPAKGLHWCDMIAHTFPMGSMTGAPKKRVLELTEKYEKSARGLFSGALGYVEPNQDFDFNVVIRSILYNGFTNYLAWFAGSGITAGSDPEKEYEECLLKVAAFEKLIKNPYGV
jgi:para-aminobenzoate synthetase component 1